MKKVKSDKEMDGLTRRREILLLEYEEGHLANSCQK